MSGMDGGARQAVKVLSQVAGVARDGAELVRQEARLAQQESKEKLGPALRSAGLMIGGGVLSVFGISYLLQAAVRALATRMPPWAASLLSGGALILAGTVLVGRARRNLANLDIVPQKTINSLKEDKEWVLHQIRSRLR